MIKNVINPINDRHPVVELGPLSSGVCVGVSCFRGRARAEEVNEDTFFSSIALGR